MHLLQIYNNQRRIQMWSRIALNWERPMPETLSFCQTFAVLGKSFHTDAAE